MRRWRSLIVLLLLIAACGGGGAADPETTETDEAEESSTEGETMADFFGYGTEDPEAQEAEYREQEARVQEAIRQCMAEAGFEYQPMLPPEGSFSVGEEWDEEEYVRTQGYGITTWYGNEEVTDTTMAGEEWVDPNQEMLEAMSESEATAWQEALYGTPEEQEAASETVVDPETGEEYMEMTGYGPGCYGEAQEAEYGSMEDSNALWEELQPEMDAMYQQVQADPRIIELDQVWSACMAERGFEYESMTKMQESIYTDLQTRFDEIVGSNGGFADPFEGWTQEEIDAFFEEKTPEEIDAFYAASQEEAEQNIDMEALAALQQEEIDLAVADFECRGDYWEVYQEVSEEYEAEFIAANRAILEEIRAAEQG